MAQGLWGQTKRYWKQTRAFLAREDNIWSWLANLVIAFIIIKFIVYPLLGFLFGSSLPVVAVVSSSMDHSAIDGNICGVQVPTDYSGSFDDYWNTCGGWYESRGISKETFLSYPFHNGFKKGDIMVILGPSRATLHQGDVLVFEASQQYPIIHRVMNDTGVIYGTKGDHNPAQIEEYVLLTGANQVAQCQHNGIAAPCFAGEPVTRETPGAVRVLDETTIGKDAVIGKAVLRIPWLGWIKILFTDLLQWVAGLIA